MRPCLEVFLGYQKGGCALIRACALIKMNTVFPVSESSVQQYGHDVACRLSSIFIINILKSGAWFHTPPPLAPNLPLISNETLNTIVSIFPANESTVQPITIEPSDALLSPPAGTSLPHPPPLISDDVVITSVKNKGADNSAYEIAPQVRIAHRQ